MPVVSPSPQDQVAVIKRQLLLLVPDCLIFLDVDDLDDISKLERYIAQTADIMIFLSRGYFQSKNCAARARAQGSSGQARRHVRESMTPWLCTCACAAWSLGEGRGGGWGRR